MLIKTYTSTLIGINAHTITIEVNLGIGVNFYLVGLPDNSVKESQQRIRRSLINNQLKFPGREITINMIPANLKKEGTHFDLSIAIGILAVTKQIKTDKLDNYLIIGELSLDGSIQKAKGILPIAIHAKENGYEGIIIPKENISEAALIDEIKIIGVDSILETIAFLNGDKKEEEFRNNDIGLEVKKNHFKSNNFSDIKGQYHVKRAFEIAATGNHNILLIGPPGSGKTMLAKCVAGILPDMNKNEAIETTKIYSITKEEQFKKELMHVRPFRKPHHTISNAALAGGGTSPKPGEVSLAHNGVLFLDELPEFKKNVLEVLRQPLEDRVIHISRANFSAKYPANFMLIAAMNPCPCGNLNHPKKECHCNPGRIRRYLNKISGPLLDRIDMHIEIDPVSFEDLQKTEHSEKSQVIKKRVENNRKKQHFRFKQKHDVRTNSEMSNKQIELYCNLNTECLSLLSKAMEKLNLSARAYHRILKVARTIADMENKDTIQAHHIAEAIQYRTLDRMNWAA